MPTVFIGGGTPSLLEGEAIGRILDIVRERYALNADAEITLEANPESVSVERLRAYRAAGVNRLSIGVQSLDEGELHFLDRLHDGEGARRAVAAARAAGFDNVNVDLIFGLPGQPSSGWGADAGRRDRDGAGSRVVLRADGGGGDAAGGAGGVGVGGGGGPGRGGGDGGKRPSSGCRRRGTRSTRSATTRGRRKACRHNLVYGRHDEYLGRGAGRARVRRWRAVRGGAKPWAVHRGAARWFRRTSTGWARPPFALRQAQDERGDNCRARRWCRGRRSMRRRRRWTR